MHALALHKLNFIAESRVSEIFLQHYKVHYAILTGILKHCLSLARDIVRKTKVGHYGAWIIWGTYKISGFNFILRLVWASITIIDATRHFEHGSHFSIESPLTSELELLPKRKHHIDVDAVYSFVLFEHGGVLQKLVKSFRFPIKSIKW